jgi:hypothetical protein
MTRIEPTAALERAEVGNVTPGVPETMRGAIEVVKGSP